MWYFLPHSIANRSQFIEYSGFPYIHVRWYLAVQEKGFEIYMALTMPQAQDVTLKMERLAEKRKDLFQLNLTINILGCYTTPEAKDSIFVKRESLQKEIAQIESELAVSK